MIITPKNKKDAEGYIKRFKKRFNKKFSAKIEIKYTFTESVNSIELPLLELEQLQEIVDVYLQEYAGHNTILCKSRLGEIALYRHIFCKLAREMDYQWTTIGVFLNRTHASIINGHKKITNCLIIKDKQVTKIYLEIISHLKLLENYE